MLLCTSQRCAHQLSIPPLQSRKKNATLAAEKVHHITSHTHIHTNRQHTIRSPSLSHHRSFYGTRPNCKKKKFALFIECGPRSAQEKVCRPNNLMYSRRARVRRPHARRDFHPTHSNTIRMSFTSSFWCVCVCMCLLFVGWVVVCFSKHISCRLRLLIAPQCHPIGRIVGCLHTIRLGRDRDHRQGLTFFVVQPEGLLQLLLEGLVVDLLVEVQSHTAKRLEVQLASVCDCV